MNLVFCVRRTFISARVIGQLNAWLSCMDPFDDLVLYDMHWRVEMHWISSKRQSLNTKHAYAMLTVCMWDLLCMPGSQQLKC